MFFQFPELTAASYNKNPAAINDPDGIVAVWNMHLTNRPEFVFHSQVRIPKIFDNESTIFRVLGSLVRCVIGHFLTFPPKSRFRWDVLWPNTAVGHKVETPPGTKDTTVRGGAHLSCIRNVYGWNSERTQPHDHQYGWDGVQLAC